MVSYQHQKKTCGHTTNAAYHQYKTFEINRIFTNVQQYINHPKLYRMLEYLLCVHFLLE